MPKASTASPTTAPPRNGSARRPTSGVADSQYNLGILYARGIGVDQNLAESYKWFALAAQQGDQDAAKKRDDVAARLDQQSLVAAKLAVQTWAADPPPDEAMNVKAPAGGWDGATATGPAKPTVRKQAAFHLACAGSAARLHHGGNTACLRRVSRLRP